MGGTAANTVTIDSTTQAYTGGTGNDTVTITADATKAITGGAGTNELILSATGGFSLTAANSGAKISGFQTLGVAAGVTGPIDMSTLPSDINALHVIGNSSDISFTKVAANTPLSIDVARTATSYKLASTGGSSKSVSVNLGTSYPSGRTRQYKYSRFNKCRINQSECKWYTRLNLNITNYWFGYNWT